MGASAGEDTRSDQHSSKKQEARQAFIERVQQHAVAPKAQPQHQPLRERQVQSESKAGPKFQFKHSQQAAAEKRKAVIPAKRQAESKATPRQTKLPPKKPVMEPQVSTTAQAKAPAIDEKHQDKDAPKARVTRKAPNRTPELITAQPMGRMVRYTQTYSNYDLYNQRAYGTQTMEAWIVYAPDGQSRHQ